MSNNLKNKLNITGLRPIIAVSGTHVIILSAIIAMIALLVIFNTIRLTIYNAREEVEVMRLVGAANWFIRGPFVIVGFLIGLASALLSQMIILPLIFLASGPIESFTRGFQVFDYYVDNILLIVGLQLAVGIGLGILSSVIAIRKHLAV